MLNLVLEKALDFQKSIGAISILVDEAEFLIDENGLSLKATDPSQISMIDFKLEKSAFKKFDFAEKTKIGLDLDYLNQIMSRAKPNDELTLSLLPDSNSLDLKFSGDSVRKFSIPLVDVSAADLPNPKIEFDAELVLKANVLQDALKDSALISTHVSLAVDGSSFFVKANSSKGTVDNETKFDKKTLIELNVKKEAVSMFPLDYLQDMLKTPSSDSIIQLSLKSKAPVKISYEIGKAKITYFLAPRIETD